MNAKAVFVAVAAFLIWSQARDVLATGNGQQSKPAPVCRSDPAAKTRLQRNTDKLKAALEVPGLTTAVMFSDGTLIEAASGFSDRESGVLIRPDSKLLAASIGKTFVAAVVLSLVRDGALSLDDPIAKWLSKDAWFPRLANASSITVRMLLNHTSGLPNHADEPAFFEKMKAASPSRPNILGLPRDAIEYIAGKPALSLPGKAFHYGDTNYILLGIIIERASGKRFYDIAQQRFLDRLRLTNTRPSDKRAIPGLTAAYLDPNNAFGWPQNITTKDGLWYNPGLEWTGGGFASTSGDLARWAGALFEARVIPAGLLKEMLTGVPMSPGNTEKAYGLGVAIVKTPQGAMYGHGGDIPGFSSIVGYFPDKRVSVAAMTNIYKEEFSLSKTEWLLKVLEMVCGA